MREEMITSAECARRLRTSTTTLNRMRAAGIVRGYRLRNQLRFIWDEVKEDLLYAEAHPQRLHLIYSGGRPGKPTSRIKGLLKRLTIEMDSGEPIREEETAEDS